jgi:hypothetical protein
MRVGGLWVVGFVLLSCSLSFAAKVKTTMAGGPHDLRPDRAGGSYSLCSPCHVTRRARPVDTAPGQLWASDLPQVRFIPWDTQGLAKPSRRSSLLCMTCHDGTVAPNAGLESDRNAPARHPMAVNGQSRPGRRVEIRQPRHLSGHGDCEGCHEPHGNEQYLFRSDETDSPLAKQVYCFR